MNPNSNWIKPEIKTAYTILVKVAIRVIEKQRKEKENELRQRVSESQR